MITLCGGQADNTYASYFRSSFNDDYAEAFSYNFGANTKTIKLSINKDISRNVSFQDPIILQFYRLKGNNTKGIKLRT
jgi:hypothetical protein